MTAAIAVSETPSPFSTYTPAGSELALVLRCVALASRPAVMLRGPTGCGKSTMVQDVARRCGRRLVTVVCHGEQSPSDLVGRFHLVDGETRFVEGPVTRAVREGHFLLLDEFDGASAEVVQLLLSLLDHRRTLTIPALGEEVKAAPDFQVFMAYNPGYRARPLAPSVMQRCIHVTLRYLPADKERALLQAATGIGESDAAFLVDVAGVTRERVAQVLPEVASTRVLLRAAELIASGLGRMDAVEHGVLGALSDDPQTIRNVVQALSAAGLVQAEALERFEVEPPPSRRVDDDDFYEAEDDDDDDDDELFDEDLELLEDD